MSPEPAEHAEPADADSPALALAKRRGKRASLALFLAFASAFIVLSTWEVIAGVFGLDAPGGIAAHGKPDEACTRALRAFGEAVDRENGDNSGDSQAASAQAACLATGADLDAFAAVARFRRARAAAASRHDSTIAPLRRDLQAYLER
jgi:hypothetical protein